jgi:hypothetical protein
MISVAVITSAALAARAAFAAPGTLVTFFPNAGGSARAGLAAKAKRGKVTLLYAARDRERNNALALKEYLERWGQ